MRQTLLFIALLLLSTSPLFAQQWAKKVDVSVLQSPQKGCWILMQQQANTQTPAQWSKSEKTRYVFEHLQKTANESQSALQAFLTQTQRNFRSYWIINAIYIPQPDLQLIEQIAQRNDIARILPNDAIQYAQPERDAVDNNLRDAEPEWGLTRIAADRLWALGINGQGAVIGGQDTGYDWDHPALLSAYRGWNGSDAQHHYNWHDAIHEKHFLNADTLNPCGFNAQQPCDDGSHGTHTMGTMVGLAQDRVIGVAPQAQWVGCRNMDRGWGTPETYIECFQWFLAPTDLNGQNANPDKAPHVINNSWGCPSVEGCNENNFETMRIAIENLRNAGVVVVVSAGNDGPSCNSVKTPAAIFGESFSVGASTPEDTIAGFSSRGLVTKDDSQRMKPNVSAPGTKVLSCVPNGNYAIYQGTSMAGPHVAGAVALLISAEPSLAGQVERIEEILEQTASPISSNQVCDGISPDVIPNPISGYGRIDLWKALSIIRPDLVNESPLDTGKLRVFPNPTTDQITLIAPTDMDEAVLSVYTSVGALMYRRTETFKRILQVDLSSLPNGLYLVTVQSSNNRKNKYTAKVIVR